jgi:septal ring factor EnvC (AmiA/AmiB activator)
MGRCLPYLLFAFCCISALAFSSAEDEIKKRQVELQTLRDQIRAYEETIKEQQRTEHATLELLDSYDKKAILLRRLIAKLRREEEDLQRKIETTQKTLDNLSTQISFLKHHYAQHVVSVYKAGPTRDLELLLSSRSINQFYVRNEYLKRFSAQRKADVDKILRKTKEIEEVHARAQQELTEERRLIAEKGAEEDRLAALADERREVLVKIRSDRKSLQREIDRKVKAAKDLEDMVTRLIEMDRVKKEREEAEGRTTVVVPPPPRGGTFDAKKGHLRWPVSEGAIVGRFGAQKHPTLKTVTQNTGIDIAVKAGSTVYAVADGEVARIWWLPSYGNLIIMNHANGFRTVYTHLSGISVDEGQKLAEGEPIGESGESVDGPRLHFEIWKDKEKQNPEQWLRKQ